MTLEEKNAHTLSEGLLARPRCRPLNVCTRRCDGPCAGHEYSLTRAGSVVWYNDAERLYGLYSLRFEGLRELAMMRFCPVCGSDNVGAAMKCAVCGAEIATERPQRNEQHPPEADFVEACRAGDETEAQVIRGALEANGIECVLRGESLRLTHGITVDGLAEVAVLVRHEDADRAREVIARARGTAA